MLKVDNLDVYYGGIHALKNVNISVNEGEIVSIIGSNGAGKSTLINTISGIVKFKSGSIKYYDKELPNQSHKIVELGICQVPEGRLIFANLTVIENIKMGAFLRDNKDEIIADIEKVFKLFPRLKEREKQIAGTLSGGEQQMLAIGRGLMSNPKLILLDEPSLGLAPILINTIFDIILEIKQMGKTILLVEQNAFKALSIADKAYVLEQGKIICKGNTKDLINTEDIQMAYLGKKAVV